MSDLVSVVIPAFNMAQYLGESIESVLRQSYDNIEVIVVDDGSTDNTRSVAESLNVRYIYQDNAGVASAMNTGLKVARGSYLASNDADDLWLPDKIQQQLDALVAQPEVDAVFGMVEQFLTPEIPDAQRKSRLPEESRIMPGYTSATMLIRTEVFERIGYFNESIRVGDFIEWYARAQAENLSSCMLDQIVARRRIHNSNTGVREKYNRSDYLKVLRQKLARERGNA